MKSSYSVAGGTIHLINIIMNDILVALPLELALEVVSWLPSKDLLALGRTSKAWQQVIAADNNDEVLWRGRATAEFDAKTPCKNLGGDHMTWNSICRYSFGA